MAKTYEIAVELAGRMSRSFNQSMLTAAGNLERLNNRVTELETDQNRVTRFRNLKRELGETQQQFTEAQGDVSRLARELEEAKGPTRDLKRQMNAAQEEVDRLGREMREAEEPSEALTQQFAQARDNVKQLSGEYRRAERNQRNISRQFERAKDRARGLNNAVDEQREQLQGLRNEMREAGQSTTNLTQQQRELAQAMQRAERRAAGWRRMVGADLPGAAGRFGNEVAALGQRAAVAGGVVGTATGFMVQSYATAATETQRWGERLGVTTSELSRLQYVGEQYGVQNDAMIDGIKELSLRADEFAVTAAGPAAEAFDRLGLSQQQVADASGDTERLMGLVSDRLREVENVAARQRIVDEIFGGQGGEQMAELASASAEEIQRLKNRADELGYTMGTRGGKQAEAYSRALREAGGALQGVRNTMAMALIPALTDGMRQFSQWVADNREQIERWGSTLGENVTAALPRVVEIAQGVADMAGKLGSMVATVAELVGGYDNLGMAIAAAFSAKAIIAGGQLVGSLFSMGRGAFMLMRSLPVVSAVTKGMTAAQWALNAAMMANPIGLVIAGIAALIGVGYLLWRNWDAIKEKAAEVWQMVSDKVAWAVDAISTVLGNFNPVALLSNAWSGVTDYLGGIDLSDSGRAILDTLGSGIMGAKDALLDKLDSVFSTVREYLPFSDAKRGPLSDLTLSGQRIMTTLGDGVARAGAQAIQRPMARGMAAGLAGAMAVAGQGISVPVSASGGGMLPQPSAGLSSTLGLASPAGGGGAGGGSRVVQLSYSPTINLPAGSPAETRQAADDALAAGHASLLEQLRTEYEDEERTSYA